MHFFLQNKMCTLHSTKYVPLRPLIHLIHSFIHSTIQSIRFKLTTKWSVASGGMDPFSPALPSPFLP